MTLSFVIAPKVNIPPAAPAKAEPGTSYSFSLSAAGGLSPYSLWALAGGTSLPAGLSLASNGAISGTTSAAPGAYTFSVTVHDSLGAVSDPQSLTITVPPPLTVTSSTAPIGITGLPYSDVLIATGGIPPYRWAVSSGALPSGVSLDTTSGVIGGTVGASTGTYNFSITTTDSLSVVSVAKSLSITVVNPLVISTTSLSAGTANTAYSTPALAATGGTPPYAWSVASGVLPAGLSLDTSTGAITGTPTAAAVSPVGIEVSDAGSLSATFNTSITVYPPFTLSSSGAMSLPLGRSGVVMLHGTAQGYSGNVTLNVVSAPAGITISPGAPVLALSGTQTTDLAVNVIAGAAAISGNLVIGGGTAASISIPITVTAQLPPDVVIEKPASSSSSIWGKFDLQGYAAENTPGLPNDRISSVNVSIVGNDDSGFTLSAPASYGIVARNDQCDPGKTYAGAPNCPKIQFDYPWQTGVQPVTGTPEFLNGSYTAVVTALDSTQPSPLSTAASIQVMVDNQPPTPLMVSPINGTGVSGVYQPFTVRFVSPHPGLDFGGGQITFQRTTVFSCTVSWSATSGNNIVLQSGAGGTPPCLMDTSRSTISNNGSDQVTLQLWIQFPQSTPTIITAGAVAISAVGFSAGGEASPASNITSFDLLDTPVSSNPAPAASTYFGVSSAGQKTVYQTIYLVDTSTPYTVAAASGTCAGGFSLSPVVQWINGYNQLPATAVVTSTSGNLVTLSAVYQAPSTSSSVECTANLQINQGSQIFYGPIKVEVNPVAPLSGVFTDGQITLDQSGPGSSGNMSGMSTALQVGSIPGISAAFVGSNLHVAVTDPALPAGVYALPLYYAPLGYYPQFVTAFINVSAVSIPTVSIGLPTDVSVAANPSSSVDLGADV
ncbi:MAG TPA: Ig domain-containing protein, partial [Verrucomicrobiae bacterium]|nr:Ig domain-containing protein [Verrucomicrobiae bacterium]